MEGSESRSTVLRAALRLSLKATSKTLSLDALNLSLSSAESTESQDPRFRRLVEGILFSRRFTLTYHFVLLGILALFTIFHWGQKIRRRRWRKRVTQPVHQLSVGDVGKAERSPQYSPERSNGGILDEDGERSSSSSTPTLQSTASLPVQKKRWKPADENTSLLARAPSDSIIVPWRAPYSYLKAWLMYQPEPIPLIRKTLPANVVTIAVVGFISLNAFYSLYQVPFTIPTLFIFADRAALMFVVNLPLLYLLAAKNQPIKLLTGRSYESLNIIHRRLGELMCLLALLHSGGMVGVWWTLLRPVGLSFARFVLSKIILLGIGAFVAYEAIYLTSLPSFRQRWYELFLSLHVVLQFAALVLLWFHHHNSRIYVLVALGIWAIDRMAYRLGLKTKHLKATLEIMPDGTTVSLRARVPANSGIYKLNRLLSVDIAGGWKPTEHLFLSVPSLAPKHIVQAHPFTIASPSTSPTSEGEVRLIIRAQDGFSKDILAYAKDHTQVDVRLDGPYGSQTGHEMLLDSELAIVVAGGSGIAVAWPLVTSMQQESVGGRADLESLVKSPRKQILLVWVVHQRSHISWIGEKNLEALATDRVDVIIPEPTGESGRPDIGAIVQNWIEEHDTTRRGIAKRRRIGVVCSGPDAMNRAVRNTCSAMVANGRDVSVKVEKYGW
ncbi:MAG: hypothetical protein M1835_005668 [Candelina submexicana]|nr:MAG: hypothetical protein M1835_005668 [Candelina submexicana]